MTVQPEYPDGVRTPQEAHAETLSDPGVPEVQREIVEEAGPQPVKSVAVTLPTGRTIQVPMMSEWRQSAMDFMTAGDFESWAESVLTDLDLDLWDEWRATDPKLGDSQQFFEAVEKQPAWWRVGTGPRGARPIACGKR